MESKSDSSDDDSKGDADSSPQGGGRSSDVVQKLPEHNSEGGGGVIPVAGGSGEETKPKGKGRRKRGGAKKARPCNRRSRNNRKRRAEQNALSGQGQVEGSSGLPPQDAASAAKAKTTKRDSQGAVKKHLTTITERPSTSARDVSPRHASTKLYSILAVRSSSESTRSDEERSLGAMRKRSSTFVADWAQSSKATEQVGIGRTRTPISWEACRAAIKRHFSPIPRDRASPRPREPPSPADIYTPPWERPNPTFPSVSSPPWERSSPPLHQLHDFPRARLNPLFLDILLVDKATQTDESYLQLAEQLFWWEYELPSCWDYLGPLQSSEERIHGSARFVPLPRYGYGIGVPMPEAFRMPPRMDISPSLSGRSSTASSRSSSRASPSLGRVSDVVIPRIQPHEWHPGIFMDRRYTENLLTRNLRIGLHLPEDRCLVLQAEHGFVEYRIWEPGRHNLAAAVVNGLRGLYIRPGVRVLLLGTTCASAASYLSDIVGPRGVVYAMEFSCLYKQDLRYVSALRYNVIALEGNVNMPYLYRRFVGLVDVVYVDLGVPEQPEILRRNVVACLKIGGHFVAAVSARSIDNTALVDAVVGTQMQIMLNNGLHTLEKVSLEPFAYRCVMLSGVYQP